MHAFIHSRRSFHLRLFVVFHFRKYHTFRHGKQEQKKIRRNCDGQLLAISSAD
ncbi:hypothetical protein CORTU0001_2014 [Corynebacterium tuberculostearicum SK141]|uniref:Uncharacterized protein n=1 Tax=Corynebacterium tuberculostearicum SK141 TaxID=553206 RepID=C6R8Q5_9CORY|nr:hypothetical protein CORTU0001_2014 [Corynebacterium tuberculostearicum SK141]